MNTRSLPQEGLKLIACICMLLDHWAMAFAIAAPWYLVLRGIGRIAFPIYCFLIAEGMAHTRSPGKYALRLAIGALLSELPFDYALFGRFTWQFQSVMLTLLLGVLALWSGRHLPLAARLLTALPFILAGDLLRTDYGSYGVLLIVLLGLARDLPQGRILQCIAVAVLCALMPGMNIRVLGLSFSIELLGILSLLPIALYRGHKRTKSSAVQWSFYLFYPVHLGALWLLAGG